MTVNETTGYGEAPRHMETESETYKGPRQETREVMSEKEEYVKV